jgi:hypothetical protein
MAYTTIDKPTDYFNTVLYTGNGGANSSQSITGVGFQPDLVWIKSRTTTARHALQDIIRGTGDHRLSSNETQAEGVDVNDWAGGYISAFNSDGFTANGGTSNASITNNSGVNYASWNWLASNTTASNTDGSITSSVSANTTSGFSIVSYTGTGSNATVGHGLGVAPSVIIVKNRSSVGGWPVYHKGVASDPETDYLLLHSTDAVTDNNIIWNDTAPTSTVFSIGTGSSVNTNTNNHIAYCFAEKKGFSKFGSYTGNGNADGPFIHTGFKPAFIIVKNADASKNWGLFDNKRIGFNASNYLLTPSTNDAEDTTSGYIDLVSNGFKIRSSALFHNASGQEIIYMAFAENPFVTSTGIPTTAR